MIRSATNDRSVLNVGCGPNVNAPYLEYDLKKVKSFYALDLSYNFVKQASDQNLFSMSNFSVASVYKLPFKNNTFDVVLLPFVLHHLPDHLDKALQECLRVSKKYVIIFDHVVSDNKFIAFLQNLYWNLFDGVFTAYTPSRDIQDKFAEIAEGLGEPNPFLEAESEIFRMVNDMERLSLDGQFNINVNDYLIPEIETPPLPQAVTSATPNPQVITTGQNILNQAQAQQTGLTRLEDILLSPEEKLIRQRNRGMIS